MILHKTDRPKYRTDFCKRQYLFGFCVLDSRNTGLLITFLKRKSSWISEMFYGKYGSSLKASVLGWLDFYDFLWTACSETEIKTHSILGGFCLLPQATLLIRQRFMCASFLTDHIFRMRLQRFFFFPCKCKTGESSIVALLICYASSIKRKQFGFLLPFSYRVNKKQNITFWTLHFGKTLIKCVILVLFFVHDTH